MHYTNRRRRQSASLLMRQLPTAHARVRGRERRALLALLEARLSFGYRVPPKMRSVVAVLAEQERERNHTITQTHLRTGCIITRVHVRSGAHFPRRIVALLELFRCTNIGTENARSWRDMERKRESVQLLSRVRRKTVFPG